MGHAPRAVRRYAGRDRPPPAHHRRGNPHAQRLARQPYSCKPGAADPGGGQDAGGCHAGGRSPRGAASLSAPRQFPARRPHRTPRAQRRIAFNYRTPLSRQRHAVGAVERAEPAQRVACRPAPDHPPANGASSGYRLRAACGRAQYATRGVLLGAQRRFAVLDLDAFQRDGRGYRRLERHQQRRLSALFALPATAGAWLEGHPLTLLAGVRIGPLLPESHALGSAIAEVHSWLGDAIMWVAGVHAAAALFHHFVLRDDVLASMLPLWLRLPR